VSDDEVWHGPIKDETEARPVSASAIQYTGSVWSVRRDRVLIGDRHVERDVLLHPGAVAVIAIREDDAVLLIRQYRHPVAAMLLEPPAGLLDDDADDPLATAQRELAEEAGMTASTWFTLVDFLNSPGGSSEAIRVYLAKDVRAMPQGRQHTGEAEEAHLPKVWVPFDRAVDAVLSGDIQSPSAVLGILAAAAYRQRDWQGLRPADAPWPTRRALLKHDRVHNLGTRKK
jgi:8-oxo-dGDP phosphatase